MLTDPQAHPTAAELGEDLARQLAHLARLDADLANVQRRRLTVVHQVQRLELAVLLAPTTGKGPKPAIADGKTAIAETPGV